MRPYKDQRLEWEKRILLEALREADGNQCRAASLLGFHRNTMSRKLIECGITDAEISATRIIRKKTWLLNDFLHDSR